VHSISESETRYGFAETCDTTPLLFIYHVLHSLLLEGHSICQVNLKLNPDLIIKYPFADVLHNFGDVLFSHVSCLVPKN